MGFKIWCQVGGGVTLFSKSPYSREFLNMRFKSCLFFQLFLKRFTHFLKISKMLFAMQNGVLKFAFETHVHRLFLTCTQAPTLSLRGSGQIYTRGPKGRVWWDGWDGWHGSDGSDVISKVSFNCLHTLRVYRTCIYILI